MVLAGDGCHEAMRPTWTAIEGPASKRRHRSSQGCVLSVSIWHPLRQLGLSLIGNQCAVSPGGQEYPVRLPSGARL
jgi:hypothetical protein